QAYEPHLRVDAAIEEELLQLLLTPETSGGLLAAIPPDQLDALTASFRDAGENLWPIGRVTARTAGPLIDLLP
ncbi:MAG: hypothetical protein JXO22_01345, partial [Phycisphaerae bacterium]|nr:hypothetical protein [Phycisphaerae bacterium]